MIAGDGQAWRLAAMASSKRLQHKGRGGEETGIKDGSEQREHLSSARGPDDEELTRDECHPGANEAAIMEIGLLVPGTKEPAPAEMLE